MRRVFALATIGALLLALPGCSVLGLGAVKGPDDIQLGSGAYSVFYTDMTSSAGNATTVEADGKVVATSALSAMNLSTRIDSHGAIGLIGARSADLMFVNSDGSIEVGEIAYGEGTGATAATWLSENEIASLINVSQEEQGYSNPLVVHDRKGKVLRSLDLRGYFSGILLDDHKFYISGSIASFDPQDDGSRLVVVDAETLTVLKQYDWKEPGGLTSCGLQDGLLYCLESDSFAGEPPPFEGNHLVRIDPATGDRVRIVEFKDNGIGVQSLGGRIYVILDHMVGLLARDGRTIEHKREFGDGEASKVESMHAGPEGTIDLFVRDFSFDERSEGRTYVGDILRVDPLTLEPNQDTTLELPGEEFVDLHPISADFFE